MPLDPREKRKGSLEAQANRSVLRDLGFVIGLPYLYPAAKTRLVSLVANRPIVQRGATPIF